MITGPLLREDEWGSDNELSDNQRIKLYGTVVNHLEGAIILGMIAGLSLKLGQRLAKIFIFNPLTDWLQDALTRIPDND